jgi:hypothetical protein
VGDADLATQAPRPSTGQDRRKKEECITQRKKAHVLTFKKNGKGTNKDSRMPNPVKKMPFKKGKGYEQIRGQQNTQEKKRFEEDPESSGRRRPGYAGSATFDGTGQEDEEECTTQRKKVHVLTF